MAGQVKADCGANLIKRSYPSSAPGGGKRQNNPIRHDRLGQAPRLERFASRLKLIDGDDTLEVNVRVEDPGVFTMSWNAVQRYRRDHRPAEVPLHEMVCTENNGDHFGQGLYPIPQADTPDF
jgi:hypothetical protein